MVHIFFANSNEQNDELSIIPVHHPVLDRFGEMGGGDLLFAGQVGDRPGDLERTVISPGAEAKPVDRRFKEFFSFPVDAAVGLDLSRPHLGIGIHSPSRKTVELSLSGPDDPIPDRLRALPFGLRDDVLELDPGDFDLDVDAVEEGTGDLRIIAAPLGLGALGVPVRRAAEDVLAGLRCHLTLKARKPAHREKYPDFFRT